MTSCPFQTECIWYGSYYFNKTFIANTTSLNRKNCICCVSNFGTLIILKLLVKHEPYGRSFKIPFLDLKHFNQSYVTQPENKIFSLHEAEYNLLNSEFLTNIEKKTTTSYSKTNCSTEKDNIPELRWSVYVIRKHQSYARLF